MDETTRGRMKARLKSLVRIVLLAAIAGAIGFFVIGYVLIQRSLPPRDGTVTLEGIRHPVKITFDKLGLPNIWAEDEFDAYFAVGYLHASDRLFQMELSRRLAHGRLSELLGDVAVEYDIRQRRFQHARRAEAAVPSLNEADRRRLQSYVNGINSYIKSARAMPFEFYIMQTKVEPWTMQDCITLLIFQTWFSDALQNRDQFFVDLYRKFGQDRARTLLFDYPYWAPTTIDPIPLIGSTDDTPATQDASLLFIPSMLDPARHLREAIYNSLFAYATTPMRVSESSNAWVLSPENTQSGKAILASDPHLEISRLPQFWYFLGMHTRKDSVNVLGITAPGLPMFAMGHNGKAAWAFTAGGIDLTDYYEEKVDPNDSSLYLTPDGWRPFETAVDTLRVAGVDTLVKVTTRFTRHGPVVIDDDSLHRCYSIRWAGLDFDPATMVANSFALANVHAFSHFRSVVTSLGALDANWMYADKFGTIGYQLGTPVPIRPDGVENLPLPGWVDSLEWRGYQPLNMTPNYVNPRRGWLTNDNNKPERRSSYDLAGNYAADRILRSTKLLTGIHNAAPGDMYYMQLDQTDEYLTRWKTDMVQLLRDIDHNDEASGIEAWDGTTSLDSRPTLIANLFLSRLTELTFGDELGEEAKQVRKIWMDQYYYSDDQSWYDDTTTVDTVETRLDIARQAMRETLDIIGTDTWGDRNTLTMRHPLAVIPILGSLLDLSYGPWPRSGTAGTLNASFFRETEDHHFQTFVAPSWRFVIDFNDIDVATMVLPAGVSGNPASPHFADFIDLWKSGKYWIVPFSREIVEAQAKTTLILNPGGVE